MSITTPETRCCKGPEYKQEPLYSVGTFDPELCSYTPQIGLTVPSMNISIGMLRQALRELRQQNYSAHRKRSADGDYDDNDSYVLVERTDGMSVEDILKRWER
jgi:hypothetical protein